jgi:hypothetical protein
MNKGFTLNLRKDFSTLILLVAGWTLSHGTVLAETAPASNSSVLKLKPIEIHYTTLTGLSYFNEDGFLESYKDFEDLILPLRDYEATRLLKKSESSDLNAKIFGGAGLAGVLTGVLGLLLDSSKDKTGFWVATIGGGIVFDIGGLFKSESQTAKFNCVQRYNRFARGESQVLPQVPEDEKALLNFGGEGNGTGPKTEPAGSKKK